MTAFFIVTAVKTSNPAIEKKLKQEGLDTSGRPERDK
jgi:hypothetical protein